MIYAYAAIPAGRSTPPRAGIDGAIVDLIAAGPLRLAVSSLPSPPKPDRARLLRHHQVNMDLLRTSGAVAPFRFGSVFPTVDRLRELLEPRSADLVLALERLRGSVEMTLRITPLGDGHPRSTGAASGQGPGSSRLAASPDNGQASPGRGQGRQRPSGRDLPDGAGTAYLLAKREALREREDTEAGLRRLAGELQRAGQGLSREARQELRGQELVVGYLVAQADARLLRHQLLDQTARIANDHTVRLSGPWPPSSFV